MQVDRGLQNQFCELLQAMGFDAYGCPTNGKIPEGWKQVKYNGYTNGEFMVRPYYWGELNEDEEWDETNFEHIPSGFSLEWYKYALRGAESSSLLTARRIGEWRTKFP